MHNGIGFGVFAVDIDILPFDQRYLLDTLLGRIKRFMDDLLYLRDLTLIHFCGKIDLKIFEFIEEFADIHIDHLQCTQFAQQITEVD